MASVRLSDGRSLAYHITGSSEGVPILFFHGASDSGVLRYFDDKLTANMGAWLIGVTLPGVGASSPCRRRKLVDWGRDVAELVDALGIDRFAVVGHGAGGPHALSVAHAMPDRVSRVVLVSPAPVTSDIQMRDVHVSPELKATAWLHRLRLYFLIRLIMWLVARKASRDVDTYMTEAAFTYPADADIYRQSDEQRPIMAESIAQGFMQNGEGIYEMVMAVCGRWGFRPEDVTRPVTMFYGEADDFFDNRMHLSLAVRLPNCQTHMWSKGGHYAMLTREHWTMLLKEAMK
jgi:pimeloyl-ACP methyl ester carboxylesterase